jgi:DNA-binding NtrC family response regulator
MMGARTSPPSQPPRILVIDPEQWPRSLLRAALRERGYDAVGTRSVESALRIPASAAERGPVELLVFDQHALRETETETGRAETRLLLERYPTAATLLLARVNVQPPSLTRPWTRIVRRPISIEQIVTAVEALCPLEPQAGRPLD